MWSGLCLEYVSLYQQIEEGAGGGWVCIYACIISAVCFNIPLFSTAYVYDYYAGGQSPAIPFSGRPSPTEAILNLSAAGGGITFQQFSEDISNFFLALSFLFFSFFWQECRLELGIGADGG